MNAIDIDGVLGNGIGGVFTHPICGVRIVETSRVVRRGDINTNLMTRVPDIGRAPEVNFYLVDGPWVHQFPMVSPIPVSHPKDPVGDQHRASIRVDIGEFHGKISVRTIR